jgi:cation transport regulator ChaB
VLLLFGLFSQPSIAQSRQHASQRSAEENVAKMSEAEMRAHLPHAKERLKMSQSALKTGNYSKYYVGDDAIAQGVAKAAAEAEYYYYTTLINEIEKRLSKIDSQKPKPQTEQRQQEETEQQQQEIPGRTSEQVQADLQQSYEKNLGETKERYNEAHNFVDDKSNAAKHGHVAAELVRGGINTNGFTSVTTNMLDSEQTSSPNSRQNKNSQPSISNKFINKNKPEDPKKEEPEETPDVVEPEEDDEIRKLIMEIQNDINNF